MPINVEGPDGIVVEFPDDTPNEVMRDAMRRKFGFQEKPKPDIGVDMAKGFSYGANEGIDATLNMIGAPIRAPVNFVSRQMGYGDLIPELQLARRANDPSLPYNEAAGPAQTQAGRVSQAVGEVAGASALPSAGMIQAGRTAGIGASGMLGQIARNPARAAALDATSATGAGLGVATARENELGPTGELALGLAGGFAAPNAVNMASRTYGGVRSGLQYGNRMVERARNPEAAAYKDIADEGVRAGFDFEEARRGVTPARSTNLANRNFTEDDLADIISRQLAGENADDIVRDFAHLKDAQGRGLTGDTARSYMQRYLDQNPTPTNIVDMAKLQQGSGNAMPMANLARADMGITSDPMAAERLISRQRQQPGRTAGIIEQSGGEGRNFEDELTRLSGAAKQEETAAYKEAYKVAQPVDLRGVVSATRQRAFGRRGEVSQKLNEAADLFYRPVMEERPQSPATSLRITELEEKLQDAVANNADPKRVAWLERRLNVAREQDDFSRPLRQRKVGELITDVREFMDARYELDQMIAASKKDGKSTPLTASLSEFRTAINDAARRNNKALAEADAKFSENRSIERILARGSDLGKRLTPETRKGMRDFRSMTPNQQELMRVALERKLMDDALNVKRGNAAADQFSTDAFDEIINTMYPAPKSAKRSQRAIEQQVYERGQNLLKRLKGEAVTTETARDILSGSRTAPMQDQMAALMEGPRAAADLMTGRFGKILENLSNRLARQIGQQAAEQRIRILTATDPAEVLPMLKRLAAEAKTAGERAELQLTIRQLARVGRRPAADLGTVAATNE